MQNINNSQVEVIKGTGIPKITDFKNSDKFLKVCAYCRVSTNEEEQLNSYKTQVEHYTKFIKSNSKWIFSGIYADKGISGASIQREEFLEMLEKCEKGDIDYIITKSISRFSRNTIDTLNWVRKLKSIGVGVFFEEEKIDTMSMQGELLLTVLSSVAQQELENTSSHIKRSFSMMLKDGKPISNPRCYGYDYDKTSRKVTINEDQAKVVRKIFDMYLEGKGAKNISNYLYKKKIKSPRGKDMWSDNAILAILKNTKYIGDITYGTRYTLDPISKRIVKNRGERDKYILKGYLEPIISNAVFDKAQKIREKRGGSNIVKLDGNKQIDWKEKYPLSGITKCGFCGASATRFLETIKRNAPKEPFRVCRNLRKLGKKTCPNSKMVREEVIYQGIVKMINLILEENYDVIDSFTKIVEKELITHKFENDLDKINIQIELLNKDEDRLIETKLKNKISEEIYNDNYKKLLLDKQNLEQELEELTDLRENKDYIEKRIKAIRSYITKNHKLEEFDEEVFLGLIDKVVIGGYDEEGNPDPYNIKLYIKTGDVKEFNAKDIEHAHKKNTGQEQK